DPKKNMKTETSNSRLPDYAKRVGKKRYFAPPGLTIKLTPSRLRGALPPRNKNMFHPSRAYHQTSSIKVARGFTPSQQKDTSPLRGFTIKQAPSRLQGALPPRNKNIFRPSGAYHQTSYIKVARGYAAS